MFVHQSLYQFHPIPPTVARLGLHLPPFLSIQEKSFIINFRVEEHSLRIPQTRSTSSFETPFRPHSYPIIATISSHSPEAILGI